MVVDEQFDKDHDLSSESNAPNNVDRAALNRAISNLKGNGYSKSGQDQVNDIMTLANKNKDWLYDKDYEGSPMAMPDDVLSDSLNGNNGTNKVVVRSIGETLDLDDENEERINRYNDTEDEYNEEEEEEEIVIL